jgi:signal transduction histidine kinase
MAAQSRAGQLQKSMIRCSALGILAAGVIVALASILPLYNHLKKLQEEHLISELNSRAGAVEEYLSRAACTAAKIAKSDDSVEILENYYNGRISRDELVEASGNALSNAMRYYEEVVGINRFDPKGDLVVKVGDQAPEYERIKAILTSLKVTSGTPVTEAIPPFLVLVTRILGRTGTRIGTDLVVFRLQDLKHILVNRAGFGGSGRIILGAVEKDSVTPIFPFENHGAVITYSSGVQLALKRATETHEGILLPNRDHPGDDVVAYIALRDFPWGMAMEINKDELYAPVYPHILSTSIIIGILILVGTFGMILLARPLTGKMVLHADELEEQVREKVKIIDDLYEHIVQSEKSKVVSEHTAEVAHELRQPLAIIGGFARRMIKQFDSTGTCDANQRESCRVIVSEIQRLEKILGELIDFTRKGSLRLEKIAPNQIIEHVLNVHECKLKEKTLIVETSFGSGVGEIYLDAERFEHLVRNLVSNAIEASPTGETIRIQTCMSIPSDKARQTGELESKEYFELQIQNRGPVIPSEYLQKIFSPFFTTKDVGDGIGLTVAKRIVEDHNGSISVKSDEDSTIFTIWLPTVRELFEPTPRSQ